MYCLFIIHNVVQIPDKDIERRRLGQKIDPTTLDIYIKEVYAPDIPDTPVSLLDYH